MVAMGVVACSSPNALNVNEDSGLTIGKVAPLSHGSSNRQMGFELSRDKPFGDGFMMQENFFWSLRQVKVGQRAFWLPDEMVRSPSNASGVAAVVSPVDLKCQVKDDLRCTFELVVSISKRFGDRGPEPDPTLAVGHPGKVFAGMFADDALWKEGAERRYRVLEPAGGLAEPSAVLFRRAYTLRSGDGALEIEPDGEAQYPDADALVAVFGPGRYTISLNDGNWFESVKAGESDDFIKPLPSP